MRYTLNRTWVSLQREPCLLKCAVWSHVFSFSYASSFPTEAFLFPFNKGLFQDKTIICTFLWFINLLSKELPFCLYLISPLPLRRPCRIHLTWTFQDSLGHKYRPCVARFVCASPLNLNKIKNLEPSSDKDETGARLEPGAIIAFSFCGIFNCSPRLTKSRVKIAWDDRGLRFSTQTRNVFPSNLTQVLCLVCLPVCTCLGPEVYARRYCLVTCAVNELGAASTSIHRVRYGFQVYPLIKSLLPALVQPAGVSKQNLSHSSALCSVRCCILIWNLILVNSRFLFNENPPSYSPHPHSIPFSKAFISKFIVHFNYFHVSRLFGGGGGVPRSQVVYLTSFFPQ